MKRFLLLGAAVLLAACASDETIEPPAELVEFRQTATFEQAWSAGIGDLEPDLRLGLVPASDGENVYVADYDGTVHAFRLADGETVWQHETGEFTLWGDSGALKFSAGPAVRDGLVVTGSINGEVLALDAATGERRWLASVEGEMLAQPLITSGLVVVRTTDGRVIALDAATGAERWDTVRQVPNLTIRGLAAPTTNERYIFTGFDNGHVAALAIDDGGMVWETAVAKPAGSSELDAIVDVDGDLVTFDSELYVTSHNGDLAGLAVESGEIIWRRELSSVLAPAVSWGTVFVTDINSEVHAFDRLSGSSEWTQDGLRARYLTAPAVFGDLVVVGDFEGYLHFLDITSGEMRARIEHGGEPIQAQPLPVGDLLVVLSADGELAAYRRTDLVADE
ncbi:MAG TPA: outer membrane protein assembly factor BamB [Gammaproteobacteria bacterium]